METTLLSNWKNLIIDKYNSTIDSDKHLDMYISQVSLFTIDNVILCRVFSMSLKGKALYWFTMLPPNFVDSFDTLVGRFGTQFATSRTHHLIIVFQLGPFVNNLCKKLASDLDELLTRTTKYMKME